MAHRISDDLKALWRKSEVKGFERLFDSFLLVLRLLSISYWLKGCVTKRVRNSVTDAYCVVQFLILAVLLSVDLGPVVETAVAAYILYEIYLNAVNIIFLGKFKKINAPPKSIERSILLLFLNVIQVVLIFAIFYHHLLGLTDMAAFFKSVLVLGTIGYPEEAVGSLRLLVSLQVLLDLILILLILAGFVGQLALFRRGSK